MGGSPATPQFEIAAPEFEIAPPTPKLRPEDQAQIDKAIRSVPLPKPDYMQTEHPLTDWFTGGAPTPVSPQAKEEQANLEEFRQQRAQRQRPSASELATGLASGLAQVVTNPDIGGVSVEPGGGAQTRRGIKQLQTPGQRGTGVANLADVGLQALTPLMGPAIAENPVSIAKGFVEGGVASKAAGYLSKKAGANPEQQDLAQDLAFWMPGVARSVLDPKANVVSTDKVKGATVGVRGAGAAVAVTPESVNIGGRVGPFKGSVSIPRNGGAAAAPALEPTTIEGSQVDPASQALADHELIQQRAARVANGQPAVEPPPAPPTPKVTEITQDDIQHIAGLIGKLPAELRAQGLLEAHQTMARIIGANGKVVGPDGKLIVVDSPKAAEKAAADLVNDEVDRQDKARQESEKAKPAAEAKTEVKAEAPANRRGRRTQQAAIESKAFEVAEPEAKFEVAAPEKAEVESGNGSETGNQAGEKVTAAPNEETEAASVPVGERTTGEISGSDGIRSSISSERAGFVEPVPGNATGQPESPTAGRTDENQLGQKPGFQKGQQVKFSKDFPVRKGQNQEVAETIPQGTPAYIEHAGEGMNFVRLRLADGRKISVNQRAIEAASQEKGTSNVSNIKESAENRGAGEKETPETLGRTEFTGAGSGGQQSGTTPEALSANASPLAHGSVGGNGVSRHAAESNRELNKRAVDAGIFKSGPGPEPGEVGSMKVSDLKMAPNKFQYKLGTDAEGVSSLLKEQDKFKPDLAGVVSVWRDPADQKMYVVNGHHRFELAKRTGQKEVAVRHIVAPDAQRARSIGALQNIAEGRGTPVDAAKFFRDSSMTPERLKEEGVSLGEATGRQGLALSRLDTPLFNKVVSGDLRLGRAVAIGEATEDPAEQKAILNLVDKKEARGQKISDGVLSELIRFVKESGREKETTSDLFGSQEITKSLALEKAEISDYIRQQLSKDRKLFGFVSKEGRAEDLARAGNKIDVSKSKEISVGAQQAEEVYNRLSARGGDIADILDKSAKRLAGKENAVTVKSDAYRDVRAAVQKALTGGAEASHSGSEAVSRSGGEPQETAKPGSQRKDTVESRNAEIARLREENKAILATPLMSEGGLSPAELGMMSKGQQEKYRANAQKRMEIESRIRELQKSDETLAKEKSAASAKEDAARRMQLERRIADLSRVGVSSATGKMRPSYQAELDKAKDELAALDKSGESISLFHSPESPEEPAPIFYSKAQRVALEKVPNSAPGGSILATLKNNGVKDDEIKWLGLDDFLYGKFHVTKKELMQHIAENNLQVGEVSHADQRPDNWKIENGTFGESEDQYFVKMPNGKTYRVGKGVVDGPEDAKVYLQHHLDGIAKDETRKTATKYSQYTLPGDKKNYTELLLTLPARKGEFHYPEPLTQLPEGYVVSRDRSQPEGRQYAVLPPGQNHGRPLGDRRYPTVEQAKGHTVMVLNEQRNVAAADKWRAENEGKQFKSGHFDEPNILAHVRFDERTDADGKKTLLVEEVQSDWHQKGKRQGYREDIKPGAKLTVMRGGKPVDVTVGKSPDSSPTAALGHIWVQDADGHGWFIDRQEFGSRVPDAPFKTDWHELAMKRMLRYAAEHNYDKLAWVTGQQTADRYDLAKHLETIYYEKNESDGTYDVTAQTTNGRNVDVATHVTPDKLVDHIGKDITQRIVEGKGDDAGPGVRALRGVDLKVGGEWAKRLYDQAIPNFVNKVAKKWGAKVGETKIGKKADIPADRVEEIQNLDGSGVHYYAYDADGYRIGSAYDTREAAMKAAGKSEPTAVHSVDITPQMQHSVVYEGQPLFANDGYSLIRDRAPEAWAKVADLSFATPVKPKGIKPYAKVSSHGMQLISRALRRNILGASIPEKNAPELYDELERIADQIRPANEDSAANVERFIKDLKSVEQPKSGLTIAPDRGRMNADQDLRVLHEELFHSEAQVEPGKGVLAKGVPAEMINDPGVVKMKTRIGNETGAHYIPEIIIAEAMADIVTGTPHELTPEEAESTATKYYQALAEMHGAGPLEAAQRIHELIDQKAAESGIIPAGGKFNDPENRPAREALSKVLSQLRPNGEVRGREAETGSGAKTLQPSGNERGKVEAADRTSPSGGPDADLPAEQSERNRGNGERSVAVGSTGGIGLSDEELAEWSKDKGFRVEPAGEQMGMFGDSEPVQRVFRMVRGKEQSGLVYQSQLEKLKSQAESPAEPFALTGGDAREDDQPRLFGAGDLGEIIGGKTSLFHQLHKDERGELNTGPLAKAAGTVHSFLKQEVEDTRRAKELQWEMYDLDKRHEGRVLRAKQLLEKLQDQGVTQEDRRAIDNHLDALEADSDSVPVPSLTDKQDEILDKVLLPLKEEAEAAFKKVTEGGMTIPNYNPRQTKGKGGMLDRFLTKQGQRWSGRGNMLSKQMPAAKHRVMMALENEDGERKIVSIKGGQVTAWKDGQPENIGGLSHTQEGRAFEDSEGNIWTLKQATKNEIEQDSGVRYYHDAAASTIVNWLQAKKAEAAHDFIENFKHSADFESIALKTGQGNPPKGWRTTNLPQFKGYYFEPHTAEVFDWFFDRLKSGDPDAFGAINSFMRARILLNPIKHPINIAAHALIERGVSGFLPNRMYRLAKTGAKAMNAVWNQNQDYIDALEAGAPLQSAHDATRDLVKLFYEQMADAAEKGEPWATKAAKAIGFPPTTLVHMLHKLSSKIAWPASDMMFLQAAYEYQEAHPGVSLKDSFREVGRIIPEYRLPVRIMNSTTIGKIMGSKWGTIFGSYHYGELRAFSESMKSAFGAGERKSGQSKVGDVAKGWDRLAMMALGMVLLGGAIRKLVQELSGEKDAEPAYPGVFGLLHAADRVARKEETPTQAGLKVVTPNPATMGVVQLAFNREFATGRHIYDPAAKWDVEAEQLMHYLKENVAPMGSEIERASHSDQGWKKLAWNQLDVNFPKHGAEALAQQIASAKLDTTAMSPEDRERHYARQKALESLRRGDTAGLEEGLEKGQLTAEDIAKLLRRSTLSGLADKVHDFTFEELTRVYEKANDEQQEELLPLLMEKQEHLLEQGRLEEAGVAE